MHMYVVVVYLTFLSLFFIDPASTEIYTLSLHDALPIWRHADMNIALPPSSQSDRAQMQRARFASRTGPLSCHPRGTRYISRSEEHTSELQSHVNLVCRLLLEKKKKKH